MFCPIYRIHSILHAQAIAYFARYETSTIRTCVLWNTGRTNWFLFLARPSNFTPKEQPSYDERGEKSLAKVAVRRLKTIYVKEKTSFSLTVKTERRSPFKPILIVTCQKKKENQVWSDFKKVTLFQRARVRSVLLVAVNVEACG